METVPDRKGIWRKTACSWLAKPFKPYFYAQLLASSAEGRSAGFGSELCSLWLDSYSLAGYKQS